MFDTIRKIEFSQNNCLNCPNAHLIEALSVFAGSLCITIGPRVNVTIVTNTHTTSLPNSLIHRMIQTQTHRSMVVVTDTLNRDSLPVALRK